MEASSWSDRARRAAQARYALAIDPTNSLSVFAGTPIGIEHSADGGRSFSAAAGPPAGCHGHSDRSLAARDDVRRGRQRLEEHQRGCRLGAVGQRSRDGSGRDRCSSTPSIPRPFTPDADEDASYYPLPGAAFKTRDDGRQLADDALARGHDVAGIRDGLRASTRGTTERSTQPRRHPAGRPRAAQPRRRRRVDALSPPPRREPELPRHRPGATLDALRRNDGPGRLSERRRRRHLDASTPSGLGAVRSLRAAHGSGGDGSPRRDGQRRLRGSLRRGRARLPLRSELRALCAFSGTASRRPCSRRIRARDARRAAAAVSRGDRFGLLQPAGIHVRSGPAGSPRPDGRRARRARQRILGLLRRADRRHVRPHHRGHAHRRAAPLPELTRERRSAAAPTPQPSWMRPARRRLPVAPAPAATLSGSVRDAFAARRAFPSHAFRDRPPHRTHRGRHGDLRRRSVGILQPARLHRRRRLPRSVRQDGRRRRRSSATSGSSTPASPTSPTR